LERLSTIWSRTASGASDQATVLATLFWRIVLPLLKPLLSLVILFRGVDAFRAFDQVYSLTYGGPGRSSATLSFLTYLDFGYSRLGLASAKAYVILVVIVVGVTLYRAQVLKWFQR